MKTHIVTISDTHCRHEEIEVPNGDIIIHAGDFTSRGYKHEIEDFVKWYGSLPHMWKILIAGNHDKGTDPDQKAQHYQGGPEYFEDLCEKYDIILLNDELCDVYTPNGDIIHIWGSPVQPRFGHGWAWNRDRGADIKKHWDKIPDIADIVVTHGPPFGYGDRVYHSAYSGGDRVGCDDLSEALRRVKPKMHICGHIHEDRGVWADKEDGITYVNSSSLTLRYEPYKGRSFRFDWDKVNKTESYGLDYE